MLPVSRLPATLPCAHALVVLVKASGSAYWAGMGGGLVVDSVSVWEWT
jgi:hypothetical protein